MIRQSDSEIALRLAATECECASLGAYLALARVRGEPDRELRRRRDKLLNTRWVLSHIEHYRCYSREYSRVYRRREAANA